jgi:hypothetical protein
MDSYSQSAQHELMRLKEKEQFSFIFCQPCTSSLMQAECMSQALGPADMRVMFQGNENTSLPAEDDGLVSLTDFTEYIRRLIEFLSNQFNLSGFDSPKLASFLAVQDTPQLAAG